MKLKIVIQDIEEIVNEYFLKEEGANSATICKTTALMDELQACELQRKTGYGHDEAGFLIKNL